MRVAKLCVLVLALVQPTLASVIGIDFGSDWFKVAIVKSGVPLDIVLNRESKRKTESVVTVRDGIRYFGTEATALSTRFPETTYPFIKNLIGARYNDPIAVEYRATYNNHMVPEPLRNTCAFEIANDEAAVVYTVEELLAMQLAHAKRQAEISGGEGISGAVITVPAYFNQFERQAVIDAAEIAGVRLLQLMNDGTAVALNYAMTRTITEPQYHLFFDMGAGSTSATLVRYTSTKVKKVQVPTIEILAVGYDKTLGGKSIDTKLQKYLAKQFMKQHPNTQQPIVNNARSMARLMKEANRVKQILSANTETIAAVEGVHEEIDFKVKVTRAELEKLCGDFFDKLVVPIKSVLKEAKVDMKKLDSLVLVGGAVRIPAVQTVLKGLVGEDKIAKNVNGDESNVLGAGFRAASISKQFKVREIKIKDTAEVPIEIVYNLEPHDSHADGKQTHTTLYPQNATLPSKKLFSFKRTTDFSFRLAYKDPKGGANTPILSATVSGLTAAMSKHAETAAGEPKVQAQIVLTESSMVDVEHALATFEMKQVAGKEGGSIVEGVMNFFGGKKEKKEAADEEQLPEADDKTEKKADKKDEKKDDKKDDKKSDKKAKKDDKKADKKDDKKEAAKKNATESDTKKITTEKVKLTVDIKYETLAPLTKEFKDASKARFAVMDEEDAARRAREEAMNNLEAYIYSTQAFLENDQLPLVSTEDQRASLTEAVSVAAEWLDDVGFEANTKDLKDKHSAVKAVRAPMYIRVAELVNRPAAIAAFRDTVDKVYTFVEGIRANNTMEEHPGFGLYEETEFESAMKKIQGAVDWVKGKEAAQDKVAAYEMPAFRGKDIEIKTEELVKDVVRMFQKVPKKPVVKPKTTTTSKAATATEEAGAGETEKPAAGETAEETVEKGAEESSQEDGEAESNANEEEKGHDEL
ncbi:Hypoxia up-regulated protein 1 [Podochytrium sp. JEL0797]|nr:Hypoxia up-regulated protein 1 [Podochytrium sp. JEL0797]